MSVYTRTLARLGGTGLGETHLFDVQPRTAVVVRDVVLTNIGTASVEFTLTVGSGSARWTMFQGMLEVGKTLHLELRQAMAEGEALYLGLVTTPIYVLVTGYVFSLP